MTKRRWNERGYISNDLKRYSFDQKLPLPESKPRLKSKRLRICDGRLKESVGAVGGDHQEKCAR